jgi:uncharacterized membrane protein
MFAIALLVALLGGVGIIRRASQDPAVQVLAIVLAAVLAIGTIFYWRVEGWTLLDSLYFSVVVLTTVGLGDFAPETNAGKAFTIVYLISGVGLMMAFATAIIQRSRLWARVEGRITRHSDEDEADGTEASSSSSPGRDDSSLGDGGP